MGVIKNQGIKESIVAYLGVVIGAISVIFIQPYCLSSSEIGVLKMLVALGSIIYPFILLGMSSTTIRYFPKFNHQLSKHHGMISFVMLFPLIGTVISAIVFLSMKEQLAEWYNVGGQNSLIVKYLIYALPLAFFMGYFVLLQSISRSLLKIVIPSIFQNIVIKTGSLLGIVCYFFELISLDQLVMVIVGIYALCVTGMLLYIYRLGHLFVKPDLSFFRQTEFKEVLNYSLFVVFIGLSYTVVNYVDILMIGAIKGDSQAGIYTIAFFIGTVIEIPMRSLLGITAPLVAQSFENNDYSHIGYLYKNVSINLFVIGSILLIGIWVNIDNIYSIMPNGDVYEAGKYVVLLIGLSKLFNMVTSINDPIIQASKFYRFSFFALIILAFFTVSTNLYFIPKFDIIGAALASLIAIGCFNISKLIIIWLKLKIHPFSIGTIKVILLSVFVLGCNYFLPIFSNPYIDIIIRSIIVGSIYMSVLLITKISPDINGLASTLWKKISQT